MLNHEKLLVVHCNSLDGVVGFLSDSDIIEDCYFHIAMNYLRKKGIEIYFIRVENLIGLDVSQFDWMIYNTFAAESHPGKFKREIVLKADEIYYKFRGKKILLDTYDEGNLDGFARMNDRTTPRIKVTPGYDFCKDFNVKVALPFGVPSSFIFNKKFDKKTIPLIYCAGLKYDYGHGIRQVVLERLKPFSPFTTRLGLTEYAAVLKSSKISVAVPGWGTASRNHNEAFAAHAVLFAYESIRNVKILPFMELEDGVHYVLFNFENLEEKLENLLSSNELTNQIAANGYEAFLQGYSSKKTSEQIYKLFADEL